MDVFNESENNQPSSSHLQSVPALDQSPMPMPVVVNQPTVIGE